MNLFKTLFQYNKYKYSKWLGHQVTCIIVLNTASYWRFTNLLTLMLPFCPSNALCFLPNPFPFFLSYSMPTLLLPQLEVVKVVGVPPAYPPILMANPPLLLLHTWLLPGISTYQVGHGRTTWVVTQLLIFPTSLHSPWSRLSLVTQR